MEFTEKVKRSSHSLEKEFYLLGIKVLPAGNESAPPSTSSPLERAEVICPMEQVPVISHASLSLLLLSLRHIKTTG